MGILIVVGLFGFGVALFFYSKFIDERQEEIDFAMDRYRFNSKQKEISTHDYNDCIAYMKYYQDEARSHKDNAVVFSNNADFYKNELERLGVKTL